MIYVVAAIQVTSGQRQEFLTLQRDLLPLVRAEQGCLLYVPTVDVTLEGVTQTGPRENVVVMQEKWESLASLKAHLSAPHMLEFRQKTKTLVQGVKIEVFEDV